MAVDQEMAASILQMMDAIEADARNATRMRERASSLTGRQKETALAYIEMAEALAACPKLQEPIKPPALYRKGTGRKIVSWSDCPWQPPA